jgi:hypothetical protein
MSEPSPAYRDCLLNHYEAEIEAEASLFRNPCDRTRLAFLTEHERAVLAFLDLEAPGAAESAAPLRRYLAASPGEPRGDGG